MSCTESLQTSPSQQRFKNPLYQGKAPPSNNPNKLDPQLLSLMQSRTFWILKLEEVFKKTASENIIDSSFVLKDDFVKRLVQEISMSKRLKT
jgi:hypothetical protein